MPLSPGSSRDLPDGCTGHDLSPRAERGMQELSQSRGKGCLWNFWVPGQVEVSVWEAAGTAEVPATIRDSRRSFGPCHGGTGGTLTIRKEGLWSMHEPWSREPSEPVGFASSLGGAPKAIGAGADPHMNEQSTLCPQHLSLRRTQELPRTKQSLARAGNSPEEPDHESPQQSKAMGRRKGRERAVLPPPAHPHVPSPHTATPGPSTPIIPSLRLQRPRTMLGLVTDTTQTINTPLITRVRHQQHLPGLAQHCTHSEDR